MKKEKLIEKIRIVFKQEDAIIKEKFKDDKFLNFRNEALKIFRKKESSTSYILNKNIFSVLKVAASVILFIGLSVAVYFNVNSRNEFFDKTVDIEMPANNSTTLLLSDGSKIEIYTDESFIKYDNLGKSVEIDSVNTVSLSEKSIKEDVLVMNSLFVPFGKQSKIVLSDGTSVWLNSGSVMSYPQNFKGKSREVYLRGEAYFEVTKDKLHPFIVQTANVEIEVLGTSFNVMAYDDDIDVEAVLIEGSVKISESGMLFNKNNTILSPGQKANYCKKTKNINVSNVNTELYVSWKDGYFLYEEISMDCLIETLNRYYNSNIFIKGSALEKIIFSGKLENRKSLEETLQIICKSTRLNYYKNNENEYIIE